MKANSISKLVELLEPTYKNAPKQLIEASEWIDSYYAKNGINVFLSNDNNNYSPYKLRKNKNQFEIKQAVIVHGISGHKRESHVNKEPYKDLKCILESGFTSRAGHMYSENSIIHNNQNIKYIYNINWGTPSRKKDTEGDVYLIQISNLVENPSMFPEPTDYNFHAIYKILKENITPVIFISKDITEKEAQKRKDFYKQEIKSKKLKFI